VTSIDKIKRNGGLSELTAFVFDDKCTREQHKIIEERAKKTINDKK
jgi:hypothetical protein